LKNKINNYFIGALLQDAEVFDVARIKLIYNFTLFYYFMNLMGCVMILLSGNYVAGIFAIILTATFTIGILTLLKKEKLVAAIYLYLSMHIIIGTSIFLIKKGQWSVMDGGMFVMLIAFSILTLGRKRGMIWISYLFVIVGTAVANEISGGKILSYESEGMPPDPIIMMLLPAIMVIYILWVYLKSKEHAETQIQEQQAQLRYQHLQITDSIAYASRLQYAILPTNMETLLPQSFVLYKPKENVSGDFYWAEKINETVYFAAVDCTGHGVPGAMVSMVGNNGLNKCVNELGLSKPSEILNHLSDFVEQTFSKSGQVVQDGMDIALCSLDIKAKTLNYAGANNPLYHISDGNLNELKPDKQPIGKHDNKKPYTNHTFDIKAGDCCYIFSDGFADQFGGPNGKKFKYKSFKQLLLDNHNKPMNEQKQILDKAFKQWKGQLEQVDDICIIGLKI
jgi:serine phosphatase RsbU (regulator of sigma subunit)